MFEETYASVTTNVAGREIKLETGKIKTTTFTETTNGGRAL